MNISYYDFRSAVNLFPDKYKCTSTKIVYRNAEYNHEVQIHFSAFGYILYLVWFRRMKNKAKKKKQKEEKNKYLNIVAEDIKNIRPERSHHE